MFVWLTYQPAREIVVEPAGEIAVEASATPRQAAPTLPGISVLRGVSVECRLEAFEFVEVVEPSGTIDVTATAARMVQVPGEVITSAARRVEMECTVEAALYGHIAEPSGTISVAASAVVQGAEAPTINLSARRDVSVECSVHAWNLSLPIVAEPAGTIAVQSSALWQASSPGEIVVSASQLVSIACTLEARPFRESVEPAGTIAVSGSAAWHTRHEAISIRAAAGVTMECTVEASLWMRPAEPSGTIAVAGSAAPRLYVPRLRAERLVQVTGTVDAFPYDTVVTAVHYDMGDRTYELFWGRDVLITIIGDSHFWVVEDVMEQLPFPVLGVLGNQRAWTLDDGPSTGGTIEAIHIERQDGLGRMLQIPVNISYAAGRPVFLPQYGIRIDLV